MTSTEWEQQIRFERRQKDEFFRLHPQSPIPAEDRSGFTGLDYYPPDAGYRFEIALEEHNQKSVLRIEDTQGNERGFIRWGQFSFVIGGKEYQLQAYKSSAGEERLFIPFRDTTSGKETYGAGRYLDLTEGEHRTAQGKWILDFNQAYNPWCAYSDHYACPFVDPENWLQVEIHAGEKDYRKSDK